MPLRSRVVRAAFARRYDKMTAAMEKAWLDDARRIVLDGAAGRVLEIGAGTGKNLRHLRSGVTSLVLTEPTEAMRDQLPARVAQVGLDVPVEVVDAPADRLPVDDASVDVVVSTLVLCSVPTLSTAARELFRVLRPGGELRLIEHVASHRPGERRWQSRLDGAWSWLEGSCHLDHDTPDALAAAGFDLTATDRRQPVGQPPLFRDIFLGTASKP